MFRTKESSQNQNKVDTLSSNTSIQTSEFDQETSFLNETGQSIQSSGLVNDSAKFLQGDNNEAYTPRGVRKLDVIYELLATGLIYRETLDLEGKREDEEQEEYEQRVKNHTIIAKHLEYWGYETEWRKTVNDTNTGFFAALLMPSEKGKTKGVKPVVVFRGTAPPSMSDLDSMDGLKRFMEEFETFKNNISSDIDPYAIGYTSFVLNHRGVKELLSTAGKADVIGLSLGGALAQQAALAFPEMIDTVYAYKAPGVNTEQKKAFENIDEKIRPKIIHHIVTGDIFNKPDAHLQGTTFVHDININLPEILEENLPDSFLNLLQEIIGPLKHLAYLLSVQIFEGQWQQKILANKDSGGQYSINEVLSALEGSSEESVESTDPNAPFEELSKYPEKNLGEKTLEYNYDFLATVEKASYKLINKATIDQIQQIPPDAREILLETLNKYLILYEEAEEYMPVFYNRLDGIKEAIERLNSSIGEEERIKLGESDRSKEVTVLNETDDVSIYGQRLKEIGEVVENGLVKGKHSKRLFNPNKSGGPIENLNWKSKKITYDGILIVKKHLSRFGPSSQNDKSIQRLKDIVNGLLDKTDFDLKFYTHEIQEYKRFNNLGIPDGVHYEEFYNPAHTATLEDYKITQSEVYHPSTDLKPEDEYNEYLIYDKWRENAIKEGKYITYDEGFGY